MNKLKVQKGLGVDGVNHPRLSFHVDRTLIHFEMEKQNSDSDDDFGFPDKVFEWMGSDFIGFIEYLHDNYEEIRQTIENYESGDITFTIPLETYPDDRDPSNEKLFYTLDLRIQFHEHPHSTQNSYISAGFSIDSSFIGKEQEADKKAFGEIASIASLHSRSYGKKDGVRVD